MLYIWISAIVVFLGAGLSWGGEPYRVMVIAGAVSPDNRQLLEEFEIAFNDAVGDFRHIELEADRGEREGMWKDIKSMLDDRFDEESQIEPGNWKGWQFRLVLNVRERMGREGYTFQVTILELETSRKKSLTYQSREADATTAARRMAYMVSEKLPARIKTMYVISSITTHIAFLLPA